MTDSDHEIITDQKPSSKVKHKVTIQVGTNDDLKGLTKKVSQTLRRKKSIVSPMLKKTLIDPLLRRKKTLLQRALSIQ